MLLRSMPFDATVKYFITCAFQQPFTSMVSNFAARFSLLEPLEIFKDDASVS